jgi:flagellar biosynthetic protein FlhB
MADEDKESKTEQPTQKRINEAQRESGPPHSRDFTATVTLIVGIVTLYAAGGFMVGLLQGFWREIFTLSGTYSLDNGGVEKILIRSMLTTGVVLAPFMIAVTAAGLMAAVSQGVSFNFDRLSLKLNKLNPLEGFGRIINKQAAVEGLKSVLKIIIVGYVAYRVVKNEMVDIAGLSEGGIEGIATFFARASLRLVLHTCGVLLVLALLDLFFVKWFFLQNLKMTKQEVKEERKQSDGDPHIKQKMKQMHMERLRRRLRKVVPTADVIVTNPTHFAVALRYDRSTMVAPVVIAKGMDEMALKIKDIAREHRVMMVENRFLARELYAQVKEGEAIPEGLYAAVAEILAYVYSLKGKL